LEKRSNVRPSISGAIVPLFENAPSSLSNIQVSTSTFQSYP
jgi:hypothetical protein